MKALTLFLALIAVVPQQTANRPFDPAGKWTFSTKSDTGENLSGTLELTGTPGAYTGQAVTSQGRIMPVSDVFTSPNGFVVILRLPNSSVVARLVRGADGKLTGGWGEFQQSIPIAAERSGSGTPLDR